MGKDVIIACDFASAEETLAFLDKFTEEKPYVKIGMELYYAEGPQIVKKIKERGHKIFLDLKLHDIPNTVKKADESPFGSGCRYVQPSCGRHSRDDGSGTRRFDKRRRHETFADCGYTAYLHRPGADGKGFTD